MVQVVNRYLHLSEVNASLHHLKGMTGQRGEAGLLYLLIVMLPLLLTYNIIPNTAYHYMVCHSLEQQNNYPHILTIYYQTIMKTENDTGFYVV